MTDLGLAARQVTSLSSEGASLSKSEWGRPFPWSTYAALVRDSWTAPLSPVDRALCAHVEGLTRRGNELGPGPEVLRAHGLDDVAIHDATQVIAYFSGRISPRYWKATCGCSSLVLIALTLFLDPKLAAWTAIGIGISFAGGFAVLTTVVAFAPLLFIEGTLGRRQPRRTESAP